MQAFNANKFHAPEYRVVSIQGTKTHYAWVLKSKTNNSTTAIDECVYINGNQSVLCLPSGETKVREKLVLTAG